MAGLAGVRHRLLLPLLLLLASPPPCAAPYGWQFEDEEGTDDDPWTPCERNIDGSKVRGFCRLSCTAKWSYAPDRMDCPMLNYEQLLARSHSRGLEAFQKMSQDSFSSMNSGVSREGAIE